jgi:hypothetical protein
MANATLNQVTAGGSAEDYERPNAPGAQKWAGSEGVYLTETDEQVVGEEATTVVRRSVVVDADLAIAWAKGDVLDVTRENGEQLSEPVREIIRTKFEGAPGLTRLRLQDG